MNENRQCAARSKRTGQRCKRAATLGFTVCWWHGGATPTGIASPNWKHGRYSKAFRALPERLREMFDIAANDRHLLDLRQELAMLDARLIDVLSRVDSGLRHEVAD